MGLSSVNLPSPAKSIDTVVLELPFFDDFSDYEGFPASSRWLTNQAFVGKNYARQAPTIGMVTLDALDSHGDLYPHASTNPFAADTLASQVIRLDSLRGTLNRALHPGDSIVLSFFFLPGGWYGNPLDRVGNMPSVEDSLFLDFYCAVDSTWRVAWATPGFAADTTGVHSHWPWKFVSVKIDDPIFFTDRFQFRFRNYASLDDNPKSGIAGNCDQWNIDYIYLNINRTLGDSLFRDIAFVEQAPSMLREYQAMPARQYTAAEMKSRLEMSIVNRYNQTLASSYGYHVYDEAGNQVGNYDGGLENIPAFFPDGRYQTMPVHSTPPVNFSFPSMAQHASYRVVHTVREGVSGDNRPANDTVLFYQHFTNYLAYDDGTPENGYGVTKTGPTTGRMWIACRYRLNQPDTLTAVDLFFNRTRGGENENSHFLLSVWSCNNGLPGTLLYQNKNRYTPQFDGLNKYHRYKLDNPVVVSDTIFVGFEQLSTEFINLGFDRNTDSRSHTYYRVTNEWMQSIWTGSIMMRPCFGESALVGIDEAVAEPPAVEIYPNPVRDVLNIRLDSNPCSHQMHITIMDINGRVIKQMPFSERISLGNLSAGVYILHIIDTNSNLRTVKKLIKL